MTDMIERVAKAIVARRNLPEGSEINWDAFLADARAAIEAMREPTEEMNDAGSSVTWWDGRDDEEWEESVSTFTARDIWQAMIGAALAS